jgi:hypothetical protein
VGLVASILAAYCNFRAFFELKLRITPGFGIKQRMMDLRHTRLILFAAIILLAGCRPNQSTESATPTSSPPQNPVPPSSMQTIARIHWLGMKHLAGETNAAQLMAIWNLPESARLERQTLDKLSIAPWPLLHRSINTNASAWLRPLLDDLVEDESCLEIRQPTNQPGELAFAIRLNDQRAALWQTNLARVLESLTDIRPVPAPQGHYGWSLKKHHDPNFLELTRAGEWTVFGAAQDHNGLIGDLLDRIRQGHAPLVAGTTNDWFVADVDLRQAGNALAWDWDLPKDMPEMSLAVTGDGTNVLMHGRADFPKPLTLDLEPWNIPTNLIDEQQFSFTMVRGFKPWLESSPAWNDLQIGLPPDQICFWALQGFPMQSYFTAPFPDASNEVDRLTDWVLQNQHRWLATDSPALFGSSKTFNGLEWKGPPFMWPFLRSLTVSNQSFVYGGGFPSPTASPLSLITLQATLSRTNLVYHDWEMTGPRIEQWIYMGQFIRLVLNKAQLPSDSAGLPWLKAIAPKLGASVTDITQTGPDQLSFTRQSTIGFTGIELHLLDDWLESPQFPCGLHTFLAPPSAQP